MTEYRRRGGVGERGGEGWGGVDDCNKTHSLSVPNVW